MSSRSLDTSRFGRVKTVSLPLSNMRFPEMAAIPNSERLAAYPFYDGQRGFLERRERACGESGQRNDRPLYPPGSYRSNVVLLFVRRRV